MLLSTLLIAVLLAGASGISQFRAINLIGVWKNQLNSTFNITQVDSATMELRGVYRSASGTTGGGYSALGHINWATTNEPNKDVGIVVSFSVHWGNIGSVTTWNGIVRDDKVLVTQWFLVSPVSSYAWDHVLIGQDTFIKI